MMIYLDNNATSPLDPRVRERMKPFFEEEFGNAASNHAYGWKAKDAITWARGKVSSLLNVKIDEITFTSGATESNHMVIQGVVLHCLFRGEIDQCHIITSNVEHKCVLEAFERARQLGAQITILEANTEGGINVAQLEQALRPETRLVSLMYANNELGTINPIAGLSRLCRENSVLFHCDAAQAVGKMDLDLEFVDYLSLSAHKFYGPKGAGALYCCTRAKVKLETLMPGGGQENGLRSGTVNVAAVVGLGAAAEIAKNKSHRKEIAELTEKLLCGIRKACPQVQLNGAKENRLLGHLSLTFPNIDPDDLEMELDEIAYSNSSACSAGQNKGSYVLRAIGLSEKMALRSLRLGVGRFSTEKEIESAIRLFENL
ncbi:cysteine desulfurase family protein [Lentisphaera profundi]|uniref:cysteine desulfurase n=1 Tax=Lentisphaera profundi TaxID=1658616 RepID=A0ABY7VX46_9BACT|nr:cysteine desulfurase family protein [Lentisphaera profundi]WDE98672.1 cysteine desulfurase family protein [Lentisphaera profundi]